MSRFTAQPQHIVSDAFKAVREGALILGQPVQAVQKYWRVDDEALAHVLPSFYLRRMMDSLDSPLVDTSPVDAPPVEEALVEEAGDAAVEPTCFAESMVAADVARGVGRLFYRHDMTMLCEVPLPNGRRADLMALTGRGEIVIVEIKVSRADLLGDAKWPDYLDYCDRFFWALPSGFDHSPLDGDIYMPERSGIIIADRYDAEILRPAATHALAAARRKSETLRLARLAMQRNMILQDADLRNLPLG